MYICTAFKKKKQNNNNKQNKKTPKPDGKKKMGAGNLKSDMVSVGEGTGLTLCSLYSAANSNACPIRLL